MMEVLVTVLGASTSALGAYNFARMMRDRAKKARARIKAIVEARKAAKTRDAKIDYVMDRVEGIYTEVIGKLENPGAVRDELAALVDRKLNEIAKRKTPVE